MKNQDGRRVCAPNQTSERAPCCQRGRRAPNSKVICDLTVTLPCRDVILLLVLCSVKCWICLRSGRGGCRRSSTRWRGLRTTVGLGTRLARRTAPGWCRGGRGSRRHRHLGKLAQTILLNLLFTLQWRWTLLYEKKYETVNHGKNKRKPVFKEVDKYYTLRRLAFIKVGR